MKLVFVTQVIDGEDAVLGFVVRWIQGLAKNVERVRVLALEAGDVSDLPGNVDVCVLGREGRIGRWLRYRRLLREAFGSDGFDTLLTHMVPRYSNLAAGLAKRHGVGHFLWYTHKGVDRRLLKAVARVDKVFTASPESMRVETGKKVVTGHGIDIVHFSPAPPSASATLRLLSVGRLSPAKDPITLIRGLGTLLERGLDVQLDWVGGALAPGDEGYGRQVLAFAEELGVQDRFHLLGPIPYREIPETFRRADLFVSASRTGSVDKVVLEAMACGVPVLTCNESFGPLLAELGPDAETLVFPIGDAHGMAQRAYSLLGMEAGEREHLGASLRNLVVRDHEVDALMVRLVELMGATHGD